MKGDGRYLNEKCECEYVAIVLWLLPRLIVRTERSLLSLTNCLYHPLPPNGLWMYPIAEQA